MKTLRDRNVVQSTLAEAEAMLRSARALFYETIAEAWARTSARKPNTLEHRADLMAAGIHAAKTSATVTDMMHRLAGTTGIYQRSPLERYFRDVHVATQHRFASPEEMYQVGAVLLLRLRDGGASIIDVVFDVATASFRSRLSRDASAGAPGRWLPSVRRRR